MFIDIGIKKVLKSAYAYGIFAKFVHIFLGLLISVFINRALGTELKGYYAYICNIMSIIAIIGGLGIYQLYSFYRREQGDWIKKKFVNLTLSVSIIYGIVILSITTIITILNRNKGLLLGVCGIIICTQIVSTQLMMFSSVDEFCKTKKLDIVTYFFRFLFCMLIFGFFKRNIWIVLFADFLFNLLNIFFTLKILQFSLKNVFFDKKFVIEIAKKGFIPMLFSLLLTFNYKIDIIYMKLFSSVSLSDIGLYAVGIQLAEYIWTIPDIFKEVLYSKTAKETNINEILWCMRLSLYIEMIFLIFVFLFGDYVLLLLYGEEYVNAIKVTKIIFVGVLAMTLFKVLTPLYNAKGVFGQNLLILLISIVINIVLNMILIPKHGMEGAGIASVWGYMVCGVIYLIRFCRDYRVSPIKIILFSKEDVRKLYLNLF